MLKCRSFLIFLLCSWLVGCASTTVIETPKTAYVPQIGTPKEPEILWTSRTLPQSFDYLGQIKVRSWSYEGAVDRLLEGGKQLRADAVIDVHYAVVGFLTTMDAFAVKFKEKR